MSASPAPVAVPRSLVASFFLALVEAAEIVRLGSSANVLCDEAGEYFATPIIPVRSERREWLRVRLDGVVVEGNTHRVLGTLAELGIGAAPKSRLLELASALGKEPPARPRRVRKAGAR